MSDPVLIPSGYSAMEVLRDIIVAGTSPAPANVYMGYEPSTDAVTGMVYFLSDGRASGAEETLGSIVAVEHEGVDVEVYGAPGDYVSAKLEMRRIRYLIASKLGYTAGGLRLLYAKPGPVISLGRDDLNRAHFMVSFDCMTDGSYV